MEKKIIVSGLCILTGAGEGVDTLSQRSHSRKTVSEKIDVDAYEKDISSMDTGPHQLYRIQKLLLAAFLKTLRMAGLKAEEISSEKTGFFLGNSYGAEEFKAGFFSHYRKTDPERTSAALFPFTNANSSTSWLAIQVRAKGPNMTFVNGCNSSAEALLMASDAIMAGECDKAFVGGVSLACDAFKKEFYASGFEQEIVGMLLIEEMNSMKSSGRKALLQLDRFQRSQITMSQIKELEKKKSFLRVVKQGNILEQTGQKELVHIGNNLGQNVFKYANNTHKIVPRNSEVLSVNDLVGNAFDASGILGIAMAVNSPNKSFVFTGIDSIGSAVTFFIKKI